MYKKLNAHHSKKPASMAMKSYSDCLRDCRGQLVRKMKMNPAFISDMMKNSVVSTDDKEELDKICDKEFKADKLLSMVQRRGDVGIKQLVWALVSNDESALASDINQDLCAQCVRDHQASDFGMRPEQKNCLLQTRALLVQKLYIDEFFLSLLLQYQVINEDTKANIDAATTQCKKADCLLSYIERCINAKQFDSFLQSLKESKQVPIVEELKRVMSEYGSPTSAISEVDRHTKMSKRLIRLLNVKGDVCPILVVSRPDSTITREHLRHNFKFLDVIKWKAVFDFGHGGSEHSLYRYIKEDLGKIGITTSFSTFDVRRNHKDKELESTKNDITASNQMTWFFVDDSYVMQDETLTLQEWKRSYGEGFSEALRYTAFDIVKCNRALVVFLPLSDDEVMLATAKKICKKLGNCWLAVVHNYYTLNKLETSLKDFYDSSRCVAGMRWDHVNETIMNLFGDSASGTCQLPTSSGATVTLPVNKVNYFVGLDVLGCEDYSEKDQLVDLRKSGKLDEFEHDMEYRFYKGDKVDWWNFHFSHAIQRDCFQKIIVRINTILNQGVERDQPVVRINLLHQPSAGGTTLAKSVLWSLRKECRCAVVESVSLLTLAHIVELRSYKDEEHPLPVLLLLDSFTDDETNEFFAELVQKAKETSRFCSETRDMCAPCYVLLVCKRDVSLTEETDESTNQFTLHAHLSDGEISCLKKIYVTLEIAYKDPSSVYKKHNPKNFISFNILKSNFDHEYMKLIVGQYTEGITQLKERQLLKYISLLNKYDIQGQSIPVTSFDMLMGQKWETEISEPLRVLLNQTSSRGLGGEQAVKIVNVDLSGYIYDELTKGEGGIKLGAVMLEFLSCDVFNSKPCVVDKLMTIVKNLMKKRLREVNEDGSFTEGKFSPFIQTIVDDCHQYVPVAANVLISVFNLTKKSVPDLFVGQQIARLYIHARNWPEATKYGVMITQSKDNSYLLDTLAQVYRCQVDEKCEMCKTKLRGKPKTESVPPNHAVEVLNLAFQAMDVFRKGQEASLHEGLTGLTKNMAGYFGELRTALTLLNYMNLVDGLRRIDDLRKFLIDDVFVPDQLQCWQEDNIRRIKGLPKSLLKTINCMEEEFCHLQPRTECFDSISLQKFHRNQDDMLQNRDKILKYFCKRSQTNILKSCTTKEEAINCRFQIRLRGGDTMYGLLKKSECEIREILCIVKQNKGTRFETSFDLKVYVAASLVLCMFGHTGKKDVTHEDMAECSFKLYKEKESGDTDLEPYLFATMFNWPLKEVTFLPHLCANELPTVLAQWKDVFRCKYPKKEEERKKETTLFFLGQGSGMDLFVSPREFDYLSSKSHSTCTFWTSEDVKNRLERFVGVLKRGPVISYVLMKLKHDGNECCSVEIPTSLLQHDPRMYNSSVTFYIGFTWSGPKAFNLGEPQWAEVLGDKYDKMEVKQSYCMNVDDFPSLGTNSGRRETSVQCPSTPSTSFSGVEVSDFDMNGIMNSNSDLVSHVEDAKATKQPRAVYAEAVTSSRSSTVNVRDNGQCSSKPLFENKEHISGGVSTQECNNNLNEGVVIEEPHVEEVVKQPCALSELSTSKSSKKSAKKKKKSEGWQTVQRHSKKK